MRAPWMLLLLTAALPARAQTETPPAAPEAAAPAVEAPKPAAPAAEEPAPAPTVKKPGPAEGAATTTPAPAAADEARATARPAAGGGEKAASATGEKAPATSGAKAAAPPGEKAPSTAVEKATPRAAPAAAGSPPRTSPAVATPAVAPAPSRPSPAAAAPALPAELRGRTEPAAAARPLQPAPAPIPPPPEEEPTPAGPPAPDAEQVEKQARQLFGHISAGDARAIARLAAFPFQLEGRRVDSADELYQEWVRQLRGKRTDLLALEGLEVLTPEQMEKRYGAPPARLAALAWKGPGTYLVVATLAGRPAVAIFREEGTRWRLVGFHD